MMNIPPSEAKRLSLWEYEAILWNFNEAHRVEDDEPSAPEPKILQSQLDRLNSDPLLNPPKAKKKSPEA